MTADYPELFRFLEKLGGELEKLTELQRKKTAAVRRDDLMGVNECMKQEQVISLSLRSMDIKREKLLGELGLAGLPLSAMPERCPAEYRAQARAVAEDVREKYLIYRSAADVARTTLEVNLHQIEKIVDDLSSGASAGPGGMADIRA